MTRPGERAAPGHTATWVYGAFVLWLLAGYAAALALILRFHLAAALWQGALCVAANPLLLYVVVKLLSVTKRVWGLLWRAFAALGAILFVAQFVIPWLGWLALLRLLNPDILSWADAAGAAAAIAGFSYATGFALIAALHPRARDVEVTEHDVPIPGLPPSFDGYRIVHLSDLHGGIFLSRGAVERRLAPAMSIDCDLIAFTGDLVDRRAWRVEAVADVLAALPSADGIVAVLGNHDHWVGEDTVVSFLSQRDIQVLHNSHVTLRRDGEALHVTGVGEALYIRQDDLAAALDGIPEGEPVVLLSHAPDIVDRPGAERASLVLSGHTHGGQIVLPWIGPLYVASEIGRERASGLHEIEGRFLFVNRGLGEVFPPIRINCPPEIAVLTLRRAAATG